MTRALPGLLLLVFAALPAAARDAEGRLTLVLTPHELQSAAVAPGATFEVRLAQPATLRLVGEGGAYPLPVNWREPDTVHAEGSATVPAETPPGVYALEAEAEGARDRSDRAVFVQPAAGEYYVVAQWTAPQLAPEDSGRAAAVIAQVNDSDTALLLLSGPLTAAGRPDAFRALLAALASCRVPVFAAPGAADHAALGTPYLGTSPAAFRFGRDGYLAFVAGAPLSGEGFLPEAGELARLRRSIKPSRFSFGLSDALGLGFGMRGQMSLFIDDPLDAVLLTQSSLTDERGLGKAPWGPTILFAPPKPGLYFYDCTARGLLPRLPGEAEPPKEN